METDKRFYSRYPVVIEAIGAHEKGFTVKGELLDLSIEGAKLRIDGVYPLKEGDYLYLAIKGDIKLKIKCRIMWLKIEMGKTIMGLKFENLDLKASQSLSSLLSDLALSSLSDRYLR